MSTVLVTGGTGTTGSRVVRRLAAQGHDVRVATRSPRTAGQARFDWLEPDTHAPAMSGVDALYLVAPTGVWDALGAMRHGIDAALALGVRRFVLLSASALPEGAPMMGQVHAHLRAHAPEWVTLRPSWFMQNFIAQHGPTIRDKDAIFSAAGAGRVPFIDANDIAAVAVRAIVERDMPSGELVLTGPEALSYDDAAAVLSAALGRVIRHHALDLNELAARLRNSGLAADYARFLAELDVAIASGAEDRITDTVARVTGAPPTNLASFAHSACHHWCRSTTA